MKKCPFCAEEINAGAIKCKHCKSDLAKDSTPPKLPVTKKFTFDDLVLYIKIALGLYAVGMVFAGLWYISLAILSFGLIWWKKIKLNKKTKLISSSVIVILAIVAGIITNHVNRTPEIIISQPANNSSVETKIVTIRGNVTPVKSILTINNLPVQMDSDGNFSYNAHLTTERNIIKLRAQNGKSATTEMQLSVTRIFTDAEKAEIETQKQAAAAKAAAEKKAWNNSKAGKLCNAHPTWTKEDCQNVANNKYWIGMSIDMLKAEMGLPDSANPSNYGSYTHWQWCWFDRSPSCFYDNNEDGLIDSYN